MITAIAATPAHRHLCIKATAAEADRSHRAGTIGKHVSFCARSVCQAHHPQKDGNKGHPDQVPSGGVAIRR